jgi:hypothetical protein
MGLKTFLSAPPTLKGAFISYEISQKYLYIRVQNLLIAIIFFFFSLICGQKKKKVCVLSTSQNTLWRSNLREYYN